MPSTPPNRPPSGAGAAASRGRRHASRIGRWLVPLVAVAAALIVAEAGLRLAAQYLAPRYSSRVSALLYLPTARTQYDEAETTAELLGRGVLGHKPYGHTPGFVLNSRGFRTHEYATTREPGSQRVPGTLRVVVLGDSFTFDSSGVPYDAMWHQVAGRELERRLGRPVEVISLSAPAVGPRFALRLWELEGRRLDPDLVVFAFFVGNDFTDEAGVPLRHRPAGRLALHSYTWRLVRNLGRLWKHATPAATPPPGKAAEDSPDRRGGFELASYPASYDPLAATWPPDTFLGIERGRGEVLYVPEDERFPRLCSDAAAVVERMARGAEAGGAAFLVMVIPDEAQVDPALARRLTEPPGGLPTPLDLDRPQRCLEHQLENRQIRSLDLLPVFRRHHAAGDDRSEVPLYRPRDTHWTDRGNGLAGRTLAAELVERGLVPEAAPGEARRGPD